MGSSEDVVASEYEEISDPDAISQGDVLEWIPPFREEPWRVFGVVVTADCDLAWNKHGDVISFVPALPCRDYIWQSFRPKFFTRKYAEALQEASRLIGRLLRKRGEDGSVSAPAVADWLERAGPEGVLDELSVDAGKSRDDLGAVFDKIARLKEVVTRQTPDMALLARAYELSEPKADPAALVKKIQENWSGLPGDVFQLTTTPSGTEESMFLMLRHIRQISGDLVAGRPEQVLSGRVQVKRIARISAPYRYAITQNLGRVFADIGLPDAHDERRKVAAQRFFGAAK